MAPTDAPRYRDHPRYALRRCIILAAVLGILISIPALSPYQYRSLSDTFLIVIFWFFCSIAVCVWDLVDWKLKATSNLLRARGTSAERQPLLASPATDERNESTNGGDGDGDGDDKPDRPRMLLFFFDLFLAVAQFFVWSNTITDIQMTFSFRYLYYDSTLLMMSCTYASVTVLLSSFAHLICMWKEFMAIKKTDWEQTLRRNRIEWEERLNRIVAAAIQPQRRDRTSHAEEHRVCQQHTCTCQSGSVTERVQEENKIVERIMRVMGKLVEEPDLLTREINNDPSAALAKRYDDYDIEAGPSYQHESLLTPSRSTSGTEVAADSVETLHTSSDAPSHQISATGESSSGILEAVVVKKKAKKGSGAKGKEKASVQEVKQEQDHIEED